MKNKKTKLLTNEKKDSLKMIGLTWALTALAFPVINVLVPAFFDPAGYSEWENIVTPEGEIAWLIVWKSLVQDILSFLPVSLAISLVVGLLIKKEFPQFFTQRLLRYILLFSTGINSIAVILSIIFTALQQFDL